MKLIYIGYGIDKKSCDNQIGASVAGNNMQLGLLNVLYENMKDDLKVISIYPTASYPKEKKIFFKRHKMNINSNICSNLITFINLPFIKELTQGISVIRESYKIIKKDRNFKILTFNARPSISLPTFFLKKVYKIESVCLLADPPVDIQKRYGIDKVIRNKFWKLIERNIKLYDKVIALNKYAIELYAPNKPHIIVDGAIELEDYNHDLVLTKIENSKNIVLFTGALTEYNGIIELVEAMKYIDDKNIELHIYGDGPLKKFIEEQSISMSNLFYKGVAPNEEIKKLQAKASLLVNPRRVDDLISKVTFPSKMIEYMLSGTPVLSTKLNGLSEEYFENIYTIRELDPNKLAEDIKETLRIDKEELEKKSKQAIEFILTNKTWKVQGEKIHKFLME